jgi:hypothetical protein
MPEQMGEYRGEPMEQTVMEYMNGNPEFKARVDLVMESAIQEPLKTQLLNEIKSIARVAEYAEKVN